MTTDLVPYAIAVALLFGLAGLALERIAACRAVARRGIWVTTLILSVAFPTMKFLAPHWFAPPAVASFFRSVPWAEQSRIIAAPSLETKDEMASVAEVESDWHRRQSRLFQTSLDSVLRPMWLTASLGMVAFYLLVWLRLRIVARRWRREGISGQEVWVTENLGPAVYGFLRPMILMPQWVFDGPHATRVVVLAHEQEHVAARDPLLLMLGWLLVAIAPWNVPLWWQWRRLRFAIEVDCDARVLSRGTETRAYGEVLLSIGQRRNFTPIGAIALTEPASQLLRRIRIMMSPTPKRGNLIIATAVSMCLICVAIAADLRAPRADAPSSTVQPPSTEMPRKPPPPSDAAQLSFMRHLAEQTYPDLFSPTADSRPVFVTLLLNGDQTLYASYKEDLEPLPYIKNSMQAFKALGVDYERRGQGLRQRIPTPGGHSYVDVAAWYFQKDGDPWSDPTSAINRAIGAYYFPDLYTASMDWPRADPWVLLDRQGNVMKTGRRVVDSAADVKVYIESMYPGIKTAEFSAETIHPAKMQTGRSELPYVNFVWLADDSPVTSVSLADLSKRKDLFLYADVNDGGRTTYTQLAAMTWGSPTVINESPYFNPQMIKYIEVTAADAGADAVALRVRSQPLVLGLDAQQMAQQVARGTEPKIPDANPSAWSPETAPIRVPYGESGHIDITDRDGHQWSIVLHPARLKRAPA
jgi:beta-lactamase regulating signal transducer with metallopeptidase domain